MDEPTRTILVCGARRTGTTLLAAVLAADPAVPPLPGEAQLLWKWLETYRWARQDFATRALPFFPGEDQLRSFYRDLLRGFRRQAAAGQPGCEAVVLKSPEVTLFLPEAAELLPDATILIAARDPRDQVASEWEVVGRRMASPADRRIRETRGFGELARLYNRYYGPALEVLEGHPERTHVVRYEDLAARPGAACARLEALTGLDLRGFDPAGPWPRVAASYWAYGTSPSDTPLYGSALDASRVGAYAEVLEPAEAARVMELCGPTATRLGYPP